jgi:heme-degrading monooxygenase HmoA
MFANTPEPPYYAVVFTAVASHDQQGYEQMAERMVTLAQHQDGFLGVESAYQDNAEIVVSYWRDEAAVKNWRNQLEHKQAQKLGRERWYTAYKIRVAKVERAYGVGQGDGS